MMNNEIKPTIQAIDDILIKNNIKPDLLVIKLLCNYCRKSIINYFISKYKIEPDLDTVLGCKLTDEARFLIEKIIKNNNKNK